VKLLLDTHIWIWSLLEPEKLGERVARELVGSANEIWLSPISVWEAMLLVERGRILVEEQPQTWLEQMLRATPAREAPLTHEVAIRSRLVRLPHPDPADRFLAATAQVHGLTLATADERLLDVPGVKTLANQ
jgi:PIN domain nuclease of toxin-antitoxin system